MVDRRLAEIVAECLLGRIAPRSRGKRRSFWGSFAIRTAGLMPTQPLSAIRKDHQRCIVACFVPFVQAVIG